MPPTIKNYLDQALADDVFRAAELIVGTPKKILVHKRVGQARDKMSFDIASLTKPISTTTLMMQFVAEGLLSLDENVASWFPKKGQPFHKQILLEDILRHRAGFPAWQAFNREVPLDLVGSQEAYDFIIGACLREPLAAPPRGETIYSDIGFILLGDILTQAGQATLDILFQHRISRPLKLKNTFFVRNMGKPVLSTDRHGYTTPNQHSSFGSEPSFKNEQKHRFAPTEDCPWRERIIHGEVHDPNAYAMGGVAGHAGLFSTAEDIHTFVSELVRCYEGSSDWIPQSFVKKFLTLPSSERFVLGWDTPDKKNSQAGRFFSNMSIGHLGFTGCSLWIDLEQQFWIILLTNRIHPTATNEKIQTFRPTLHDLIYKELIG